MQPANILICTVGVSLFSNLRQSASNEDNPPPAAVTATFDAENWPALGKALREVPPMSRLPGAEISSIASMIESGYAAPECGLFFVHSDTPEGSSIADVLVTYYADRHPLVEAVPVRGLQDAEPKRFRTEGLRNLAREISRIVRERSAGSCAINATGGYKAQIALAVVLGQVLGVSVYYKHERFDQIISFPPLPIAWDLMLWQRASGLLFSLEREVDPVPATLFVEDWDERYEGLVERVRIDGTDYLELSPTGLIFHERFKDQFREHHAELLPPPAKNKAAPRMEKSGWPGEHPEIERFLQNCTDSVPQVIRCDTFYYNPDLPERNRFRIAPRGIEGVYSDGSYCVKFRVESTATSDPERGAVVVALNQWLGA